MTGIYFKVETFLQWKDGDNTSYNSNLNSASSFDNLIDGKTWLHWQTSMASSEGVHGGIDYKADEKWRWEATPYYRRIRDIQSI